MAYLNQFQNKHLEYLEDLVHLTDYLYLKSKQSRDLQEIAKELRKDLSEILCKESICKDEYTFSNFVGILWHCVNKGYANKETAVVWMNNSEVWVVTEMMTSIIINALEVCPRVTAVFDEAINDRLVGLYIQEHMLRIHRDHFKTLME